MAQALPDWRIPRPVILGTGLTGLAISRALAAAGITHVLIGKPQDGSPRLGESLNPEGSLEIVRQFPDMTRFFFDKRALALFFGAHALAFDSIALAAGRALWPIAGYPDTVSLLHVDRIGLDTALFRTVIQDPHCLYLNDLAVAPVYRSQADRIDGIQVAHSGTIAASYAFDATNHTAFLGYQLGIARQSIDQKRRVVFAHYRADVTAETQAPSWSRATSLLRLDARRDLVDGLAWCIPLGSYVSVGLSLDGERTMAAADEVLDWVEKAYAARGIGVRAAFPARGTAVDFPYEHYGFERCFGRNWVLAGTSCCQVWFHAAAGVATGLVAARLASDLVRTPARTGAIYQAYMEGIVSSHARLNWVVQDDPDTVSDNVLRQRAREMVSGTVKRLTGYLEMTPTPGELAYGDAVSRMYETDRLLASPWHIETVSQKAQAMRLFDGGGDADPWTDAPIQVPVLTRPERLDAPAAILGLVDLLSGRGDIATSGGLFTRDVRLTIDDFSLHGVDQAVAWITFLRGTRRVTQPEFIPVSVTSDIKSQFVLYGQWHGLKDGRLSVSPSLALTFEMQEDAIAAIETYRADYTFLTGDFVLPRVAFAAVIGQLAMAKVM